MQAGDLVDDEQQDARDHEGPGGRSGRAGELKSKLAEVAVPPASSIRVAGHAIESGDEVVGKDARQEVADVTANAVEGKDVETIVNGENVLVLDGVVAACRGKEADEGGYVYRDCGRIESAK